MYWIRIEWNTRWSKPLSEKNTQSGLSKKGSEEPKGESSIPVHDDSDDDDICDISEDPIFISQPDQTPKSYETPPEKESSNLEDASIEDIPEVYQSYWEVD